MPTQDGARSQAASLERLDAALGSGSDSAPEGQAEPGFENVGSEQPNAPFGPQQPGGSSGRTPPKNSLIQFITNLRNDPPAAAAPSPGAQARADQFNSVFTNLRATPTRDNRLAVQGSRGGHSVVFSGRPSAVNNIYFSARNNPRPSLKTLESQAAQDARLAATRARLRAETPAERQRRQSAGAAYRAALAAANARRGL